MIENLNNWLKANYPDVYRHWTEYRSEKRRRYMREWMKDHYKPAKEKTSN